MNTNCPPEEIIQRFCDNSAKVTITPLGQGNINDTFLLRCRETFLVLQGINRSVFPDPQILISNFTHLCRHLHSQSGNSERRWEDAVLVPATDGSTAITDTTGTLWRALSYIQDSITFSHAETNSLARQTGWALGHFHRRVANLAPETLQPPLPEFHVLSSYLREYQQLSTQISVDVTATIQWCQKIIAEEQAAALILEQAQKSGRIHKSVIHGDPKIANVLFDRNSHLALSIIDLDTVGPGLRLHDIGDCLRSVCNRSEEAGELEQVSFDLDRCDAALQGYFQAAGQLLSHVEKKLLYDAVKGITFELGLRFFTDYLQGCVYFKCSSPEETLHKALIQFSLLKDIIAKKASITALIANRQEA